MRSKTAFVLTAIGAVIGVATLLTALLIAWIGEGSQFKTSMDALAGVLAILGSVVLVSVAIVGAIQQTERPRLSAAILVADAIVGFLFTGIMWIIPAALFLVAAALGLTGRAKVPSAQP